MLPLFRENANDSTTMYHSLRLAIETTTFLNAGQTPILEADQPLYDLCKKLQWKYPDTVGEKKWLLMIGAMHTEKMIYSLLGDWLSGSGWTVALAKACVATNGTAVFSWSCSYNKDSLCTSGDCSCLIYYSLKCKDKSTSR